MTFVNLITYKKQLRGELEQEAGVAVAGERVKILSVLLPRLVEGSPADTGELRQGWHVTIGRPSGVNKRVANPLADALTAIGDTKTWVDPLYIQNNVPHAAINEFGLYQPPNPGPSKDPRPGRKGKVLVAGGYSTQAPNGIVGDAVEAVAVQFNLTRFAA